MITDAPFIVPGEPVDTFSPEAERAYVEKHLLSKPPKGVPFRVGDTVAFLNDQGALFEDRLVIGFSDPKELHGRTVHLSGYSPYWFPMYAKSLTLTRPVKDSSYLLRYVLMRVKQFFRKSSR